MRSKGQPPIIEERSIPEPGAREARIRVHACGICHSDQFVVEGLWPGLSLPRVPGHEVAGVVDAVGSEVKHVKPGQRVGVGWYGGHCGTCSACREGDFILCENGRITGFTYDGGYAEYMIVPVEALAFVPDGISFAEAAPLLCAGVTTFNALRHSEARPGDLVAIQGLGGLGHLGVQFARAMGFRTVALARGAEKASVAQKLGAHEYVDTTKGNAGESLAKMGGARAILATAPSGQAMTDLVSGLGRNGSLIILAAPFDPFTVAAPSLIMGRRRIQGWPGGQASDSTDAVRFAVLENIRPMIETFPLQEVNAAYERMLQGKVRFRAVLQMDGAGA